MVTACVFQTGKIIITGGNSYEQVLAVYTFLNKVMKTHYTDIYYREPIKSRDRRLLPPPSKSVHHADAVHADAVVDVVAHHTDRLALSLRLAD